MPDLTETEHGNLQQKIDHMEEVLGKALILLRGDSQHTSLYRNIEDVLNGKRKETHGLSA